MHIYTYIYVYLIWKKEETGWHVAQMVQHLPNKHKVLNSKQTKKVLKNPAICGNIGEPRGHYGKWNNEMRQMKKTEYRMTLLICII
jgi:hypothetical protein